MSNVKKVCLTVLIVIMAILLSMSVLAADVGKSTPAIDGDKDAAYDQSHSFNIFDQENATKGSGWYSTSGDTSTSMDADIYYLWDDSFLYAFIEVQTEKLTDAGESYIMDSDNPWESEAVELWFLWTDLDDSAERIKISVEPFYSRNWGEGLYYQEISEGSKAVAKVTDKGYNAEFAVKIPSNYLKQGGQIKATLQVNDHSDSGTVAVGQQITSDGTSSVDLAMVLTLGAAIAAPQPEPEPEPVVPETPLPEAVEENTPAPAAVTVEVPQTSDRAALVLIMLVISCAGMVAILKKKKSSVN